MKSSSYLFLLSVIVLLFDTYQWLSGNDGDMTIKYLILISAMFICKAIEDKK